MSSSVPTVEPPESMSDAPDWNAVTEEVTCPRCEYNLRGLPTPRCPECGLEFSWQAIFEAAHHRREWLFEHQWTKKPIRTFFQTLSRTTRPWSFWRELRITDRPNFRALGITILLLLLWTFCAVVLAELIVSGIAAVANSVKPANAGWVYWAPSWFGTTFYSFPLAHSRFLSWASPFLPGFLVWSPVAYFLSIWGALHIYQQTLARHRIKSIHLMRVAAYAFAPLQLWLIAYILIPLSSLVYQIAIVLPTSVNAAPLLERWTVYVGHSFWFAPLILSMISVPIGLQVYLKLPRGWLLGIAADVIAILVLLNLLGSLIYL